MTKIGVLALSTWLTPMVATSTSDILTFLGVLATAGLALFGVVYTQRTTRALQAAQLQAQKEQKKKDDEQKAQEDAVKVKSVQAEAEAEAFRRARETYEAMLTNTAIETARLAKRAIWASNRASQLERYIRANKLDVPPEEEEDE